MFGESLQSQNNTNLRIQKNEIKLFIFQSLS